MKTLVTQIKGFAETQTSEETYFLGAALVVLTIVAFIFFMVWSRKPKERSDRK